MAACSRKSQRDKILERLLRARKERPRGEAPAPELAAVSLQYNARVFELRQMGFTITSRIQVVNGVRHGFFKLETGPATKVTSASAESSSAEHSESTKLFSDGEMVNHDYDLEHLPD